MASFYERLASTALNLLTKYGQTVTVTRENVGTVDPITGEGTPAADTTFTAKGCVFNYNQALIDGAQIKSGDKKIILESTNEPMINDVVTTTEGDFTVISVKPTSPAGTVVIYELQVRY